MSKYTTELRYLVENQYDLGLRDYPIFDETYRAILNNKIIQHFYFREIGFETVALFKNRLNTKLNEIMPYYNEMYSVQKSIISPLLTDLYEETFDRNSTEDGTTTMKGQTSDSESVDGITEAEGATSQHTTGSSDKINTEHSEAHDYDSFVGYGKQVSSDTPQTFLAEGTVYDPTYASQASYNESDNTTTTDRTSDLTQEEST